MTSEIVLPILHCKTHYTHFSCRHERLKSTLSTRKWLFLHRCLLFFFNDKDDLRLYEKGVRDLIISAIPPPLVLLPLPLASVNKLMLPPTTTEARKSARVCLRACICVNVPDNPSPLPPRVLLYCAWLLLCFFSLLDVALTIECMLLRRLVLMADLCCEAILCVCVFVLLLRGNRCWVCDIERRLAPVALPTLPPIPDSTCLFFCVTLCSNLRV